MRRLVPAERILYAAGRFYALAGFCRHMILIFPLVFLLCHPVQISASGMEPAGGKSARSVLEGGGAADAAEPAGAEAGRAPEEFVLYEQSAQEKKGAAGRRRSDKRGGNRRQREIDYSQMMDRAGLLIKDRRYGEAANVLETICEDYPQIQAAAEMLARCYMMTGRPQEAVALLESRIRDKPDYFAFRKELGNAYLDLGMKEKAVEAWSGILTGKKESASYYGIVAKLEREAGLYDEALETLREGRRFERHFSRYTMDIIQLERILGRSRIAFRESIDYVAGMKEPSIEQARFAFDIFRESGRPEEFLADVDSAAAGNADRRGLLELLRALLTVDAGKYVEAGNYLGGQRDCCLEEGMFYTFLKFIAGMRRDKKGGDGFDGFFRNSLGLFLDTYPDSPMAPGVILIEAFYQRESASGGDPAGAADLVRVAALADSAMKHPRGAPYIERAAYLKAEVQLDDMHMPVKALETLGRVKWRRKGQIAKMEELRARALLASGRWEAARERLGALSKNQDSTLAALGLYSLGRLRFLSGGYGEAVEELSAFAEKYPWSKWANDALGTAMMIGGAMDEEGGALDLYRWAIVNGERGNYGEAVDSLEALESRYAASGLAPRAIFLEAELEESAGRRERAEEDYRRLAERFPLHELAPRALERLGLLMEDSRPEEAIKRYTEIMERYPDDPFLERVRNRYIALRKGSMVIEGEGR